MLVLREWPRRPGYGADRGGRGSIFVIYKKTSTAVINTPSLQRSSHKDIALYDGHSWDPRAVSFDRTCAKSFSMVHISTQRSRRFYETSKFNYDKASPMLFPSSCSVRTLSWKMIVCTACKKGDSRPFIVAYGSIRLTINRKARFSLLPSNVAPSTKWLDDLKFLLVSVVSLR